MISRILPITLFLFCWTFSSLKSQKTLSFDEYLSTALSEPQVTLYDKKADFINDYPNKLPLLDRLQFRTQTDEFNLKNQDLTLRANLNGKKERAQQDVVEEALKDVTQNERQIAIHDVLLQRYTNGINYYLLLQQQRLYEAQKVVLADKLNVLRQMAQYSTDFDLTDYIKSEDESHSLELDMLELNHNLELIQDEIAFQVKEEVVKLDTTNFIRPTEIMQVIKTLPSTYKKHPVFAERYARLQQQVAEFKLEGFERERILDYVQLKYGNKNDLAFYREFSIGVGLNIPLKKVNQIKVNEIKLEKLEDREKLANLEYYYNQEIKAAKAKASLLWEQLGLLEKQYENSQANFSARQFEELGTSDPVAVLKIAESLQDRQQLIFEVKESLYAVYLDLLDLTGVISREPMKNYLQLE